MHWSNRIIAVAVCSTLYTGAAVAQDARPRKVSQEHDELSNADYTASIDASGRAVFTVKAGDFLLEKTVDNTGAFTLRISQNSDVVTVLRDQQGYQVRRGERAARLDPRASEQSEARDAIRSVLLGSKAVRSLRHLSLVLENRDEREQESPVTVSALVDGGLIQMLDGDPGALPRIAKRIVRKQRAKLQQVRFLPDNLFKDCVGLYETSLLDAWNQYIQCMDWAVNVHWWFSEWAEDWCHWEWMGRAQAYLWQFVSCFALPI
jgi:hypothetical protein